MAGTGEHCLPFDENHCGDGGKAPEASLTGPKGRDVKTREDVDLRLKGGFFRSGRKEVIGLKQSAQTFCLTQWATMGSKIYQGAGPGADGWNVLVTRYVESICSHMRCCFKMNTNSLT